MSGFITGRQPLIKTQRQHWPLLLDSERRSTGEWVVVLSRLAQVPEISQQSLDLSDLPYAIDRYNLTENVIDDAT